ncbi:MAG: hypothetical protein ACE14M_12770 [Terriglobales bacterium]
MHTLHRGSFLVVFLATLLAVVSLPSQAQTVMFNPEVRRPAHHSASPPLREIPAGIQEHFPKHEIPLRHPRPGRPLASFNDPVAQPEPGAAIAASSSNNFDGIGEGFVDLLGNVYDVNVAPPDTNLAVGPNHIVQWVNLSFAVFDKATGALLYGPVPGNTLWRGTGDLCETDNSGDIIVKYDRAADRWIMTQPAFSGPYYQCFAISTTGDPTGSWNRYDFQMSTSYLNDYPKVSVWTDAYYYTYNAFLFGILFSGPVACGVDRNAMLNGQNALMLCWKLSSQYDSLLPADLDGTTPPQAGSPGLFAAKGSSSLYLWRAHLDFVNTGNSTLTGPTSIPVAAYSEACGGGFGTCVPQLNSTQQLDSLSDRLMYRLAYRNFGDHESLVTNHSVTSGNTVGIRWYEVRNPFGTPAMYQQGTYAPDATNYRWMGSIAMDHAGNIAMGYSISSAAMYPSIRYTGRAFDSTDPPGTMGAETTIIDGTGSQQSGLSRWGDYSSLVTDPSDDCTFWYTTEYLKNSGTFNWNTRIASFKFSNCGTTTTSDYTIAATPSSQTVTQGSGTSYTVSIAAVNGFTGDVALGISGLPSGATYSFTPATVTGGAGSSTLTVNTAATTPAGSYTLTINGTSGSLTHSTTVTLVVNAAPAPDFTISATPSSQTVTQGGSTSYTVSVGSLNGFSGTVSFVVSGLPSGATGSFNPTNVPGSGSSTLSVSTASTTPAGTYTLTISGTSGSLTHSTTVTLVVNTAPAPVFGIGAAPSSQTVVRGRSTSYTVTATGLNGYAGTVSFSVSGLPAGTSGTFNPASVSLSNTTTSASSTLNVAASSGARLGTSTLNITGSDGTRTHSTSVTLQVKKK